MTDDLLELRQKLRLLECNIESVLRECHWKYEKCGIHVFTPIDPDSDMFCKEALQETINKLSNGKVRLETSLEKYGSRQGLLIGEINKELSDYIDSVILDQCEMLYDVIQERRRLLSNA